MDEKGTTALDCPPLDAPLHLLAGLLGLRVPLRVKLQALRLGLAVRFGRGTDGLTLAEYFRRTGQGEAARRLLWDPLALAIVNESPERAAAVLFHRVYQEAFLRDHRASRLVFLRRGWGVLLERLARYFEGRGGVVRRGALAEAIELEAGRVSRRPLRAARAGAGGAAGGTGAGASRRARRGGGLRGPRPRAGSATARGVARPTSLRRPRSTRSLADRLGRDVAGPRGRGPPDAGPARLRGGVGVRQGSALSGARGRPSTSPSS